MEFTCPLRQLAIAHDQDRDSGLIIPLPSDAKGMLDTYRTSSRFQRSMSALRHRYAGLCDEGRTFTTDDLAKEALGMGWDEMTALATGSILPPDYRVINDRDRIRNFTRQHLFPYTCGIRKNPAHYSEADAYVLSPAEDGYSIAGFFEATMLRNVFKLRRDSGAKYVYIDEKEEWVRTHRQSPFVSKTAPCVLQIAQDSYVPCGEKPLAFPLVEEGLIESFHTGGLAIVRFPVSRDQFREALMDTEELNLFLSLGTERAKLAETITYRADQMRYEQRNKPGRRIKIAKFDVSISGKAIYKKKFRC